MIALVQNAYYKEHKISRFLKNIFFTEMDENKESHAHDLKKKQNKKTKQTKIKKKQTNKTNKKKMN